MNTTILFKVLVITSTILLYISQNYSHTEVSIDLKGKLTMHQEFQHDLILLLFDVIIRHHIGF